MGIKYNREQIHAFIYVLSLMGLAVGVSTAVYVMSVSTVVLFANWVVEGRLKKKLFCIWHNKAALAVLGIFFLHVLWLPFSKDYAYGIDDLRKKLPLLIIPLVLASSRILNRKQLYWILGTYVFTVFLNSVLGFYNRIVNPFEDYRSIVKYISQIRFSLNVCLSFFLILFFVYQKLKQKKYIFLFLLFVNLWFLFFLVICQSLTGIFIILIGSFAIGIYFLSKNNRKWIKISIMVLIAGGLTGAALYLKSAYDSYFIPTSYNSKPLALQTRSGNFYQHDTAVGTIENGNYVNIYICEKELKETWNKRSTLNYEGLDGRNQHLSQTLIRYLNSKSLRKDAEGVNSLSDVDIQNIENGIANVVYTHKYSLKYRLYQVFFELDLYYRTGHCKGSSLTQRFELWKNALYIIEKHFWIGVGTGDVALEVKQALQERNSDLKDTGMRTHNQFMTFWLTFGILGFAVFMFCLLYPAIKSGAFSQNYLYILFFIISCFSMFFEDTLETQAGVTFFALFNALLLFQTNSQNSFFCKEADKSKSIS